MATRPRGAPHPLGSDPNDAVSWLTQLATWVDDRPGVAALTTTQRNALTGVELWDGRVILNTTTDRINRYDAGTTSWIAVADSSEVAALLATTGTPAQDGLTASRGVSASAARADHVHPEPLWAAYTPTIVNGFSAGTTGASILGRWVQHGKTVHFRVLVTLGSGFTMGNGFGVTLPVTGSSSVLAGVVDRVRYGATGNNVFMGFASWGTTAMTGGVPGTNGTGVALGPTSPFTWKATDTLEFSGTYEAA